MPPCHLLFDCPLQTESLPLGALDRAVAENRAASVPSYPCRTALEGVEAIRRSAREALRGAVEQAGSNQGTREQGAG
jgi:hypothetical protein